MMKLISCKDIENENSDGSILTHVMHQRVKGGLHWTIRCNTKSNLQNSTIYQQITFTCCVVWKEEEIV